MTSPVFNWILTTAANLNGNFATIQVGPGGQAGAGQSSGPMIINASYYLTTTAGTPGTITFQELGPDGNWRNLQNPGPINPTLNTPYQGALPGSFLGLRAVVAGGGGAGGNFILLKGTVQS